MPSELTATMIRTSGNKAALAPIIESFPLTVTTAQTHFLMLVIEENFPGARAAANSDDDGAMLIGEDAIKLIDMWRNVEPYGASSNYDAFLDDMRAHAEKGAALLVTLM